MTIKIGDVEFATARPDDLDAQLRAQTGCNTAEAKTWLRGTPTPGHVAMALRPWLASDDLPTMADLGAMIADHGAADVANQLAELYDPPQPEPWSLPIAAAVVEPARKRAPRRRTKAS